MSELRDAAGAVTYLRIWRWVVLGFAGIVVGGIASCTLGEQYLRNMREAEQHRTGVSAIETECAKAAGANGTTGYQRDICLAWIEHGAAKVARGQ